MYWNKTASESHTLKDTLKTFSSYKIGFFFAALEIKWIFFIDFIKTYLTFKKAYVIFLWFRIHKTFILQLSKRCASHFKPFLDLFSYSLTCLSLLAGIWDQNGDRRRLRRHITQLSRGTYVPISNFLQKAECFLWRQKVTVCVVRKADSWGRRCSYQLASRDAAVPLRSYRHGSVTMGALRLWRLAQGISHPSILIFIHLSVFTLFPD